MLQSIDYAGVSKTSWGSRAERKKNKDNNRLLLPCWGSINFIIILSNIIYWLARIIYFYLFKFLKVTIGGAKCQQSKPDYWLFFNKYLCLQVCCGLNMESILFSGQSLGLCQLHYQSNLFVDWLKGAGIFLIPQSGLAFLCV